MIKEVQLKRWLIVWSVFWGFLTMYSSQVTNPNTPIRGRWDFNLQKIWQVDSAGQAVFVRVSDIEVDKGGILYIFDRKYNKVFVLDANGHYLYAFGKKGEGPGEFKWANDVILFQETVIIPEAGRAHFYSTKGKLLRTIRFPHRITPSHFINEHSFVYYHNQLGKQGQIISDEIRFYDIRSKNNDLISKFTAAKEINLDSGNMRISVHVDDVHTHLSKNYLYMAKGDRYVVKRYSFQDKSMLTFSIKDRQRKKISMAWKKEKYGNLKINGVKMSDRMIKGMIEGMPDLSEFITRILVDHRGLIYTFVGDAENEITQEVDIFSPSGQYLYHGEMKLPGDLRFDSASNLNIKDGFLYAFVRDEEGEGSIIKCKITLPRLK
jgi:hypothetical protein